MKPIKRLHINLAMNLLDTVGDHIDQEYYDLLMLNRSIRQITRNVYVVLHGELYDNHDV